MKTIWDYKVYYPYGYSSGYSGFHSGEDRGNFEAFGLPITVNGITIGTVGWTGRVEPKSIYGTHCHIGRWAGGVHTNPQGGGQTLGDDAVVTQIDTVGATDNGRFVRVRSQGVDWVYLHMNEVRVAVGDKLVKGASMDKITKDQENVCSIMATGGYPGKDYNYQFTGLDLNQANLDAMLQFWQGQIVIKPSQFTPYSGKKLYIEKES